jgi:hypothetical protein
MVRGGGATLNCTLTYRDDPKRRSGRGKFINPSNKVISNNNDDDDDDDDNDNNNNNNNNAP